MEPSASPLEIAWRAARALTDKAAAIEGPQQQQEPSARSPSSSSTSSPLDRVLSQRLAACDAQLSRLGISLPSRHHERDDVHVATARAALLCLALLQRYLLAQEDEATTSIGARNRKTLDTLCSLSSQWGLAPAILTYDAHAHSEQQHACGPASARLASLFSLAVEPTTSLSGVVPHRILSTPLGQDILGSALRLTFGPKTKTPAATSASTLLSSWMKGLPPSLLLPLLSAQLSRPTSSDGPSIPIPPFVRSTARRLLSGQLLRPGGAMALIAGVVGQTDGAGATLDGRALDTLADLILTPPMGFERLKYLKEHALAALLPLVTGGEGGRSAGGATHPGYASAAAYVLARFQLKGKEEETSLLTEQLHSIIWEPIARSGPPLSSLGGHSIILTAGKDIHAALDTLELLSLSSPPGGSGWAAYLLNPVVDRLVLLAELPQKARRGIAEIKGKGKARNDGVQEVAGQAERLLATWMRVVGEEEALSFVRRLSPRADRRDEEGEKARAYFDVDHEEEVVLRWGVPPTTPAQTVPPDLLAGLSTGLKGEGVGDDDDDAQMQAQLRILHQTLGSSSNSSSSAISPTLITRLLSQSNRRDIASLLLPELLERFLSLKRLQRLDNHHRDGGVEDVDVSVHSGAPQRLFWYLEAVVSLVDTFGEDLVRHDMRQALQFAHYCLGGDAPPTRQLRSAEQREAGEEEEEEEQQQQHGDGGAIPLIKPLNEKGSSRGILHELRNLSLDSSNTSLHEHLQGAGGDESQEEDEEPLDPGLTRMAVELLLSTLEAHTDLTPQGNALLGLIDRTLTSRRFDLDAIDSLEDADAELSEVIKEARLVLLARRQAGVGKKEKEEPERIETIGSRARREVQEKYREALSALQDPIIPVRAHGIVLLKELAAELQAASRSKDKMMLAQEDEERQARLGAIEGLLDKTDLIALLLQALADDESYLYLHAVQALKDVALRGDSRLTTLVRMYIDAPASTSNGCAPTPTSSQTKLSVTVRLRLGEVLLHTIQSLGEAGARYSPLFLPSLLDALRDASQPTTLRSSVLSLLGTCVEAFPLALCARGGAGASWSQRMGEAALDLLAVEGGKRSTIPDSASLGLDPLAEDKDTEMEKRRLGWAPGADDAFSTDTSYPQLRRGAMLLLCLLVRGSRHQLEDCAEARHDERKVEGPELKSLRLPSGGTLPSLRSDIGQTKTNPAREKPALLFPATLIPRAKVVSSWLKDADEDALVRYQAEEMGTECEGLEIAIVQFGLGS
ncbi:hypothetical protein BDZ90DRAFT_234252 [Jaminaea rosea]|uniref:RNA polymerase II assembly factor Rtp1 C-terminal domain-containing protein n=1 Tax=Jaminaea rosea TaxID=1569628 RepID=A0A316UJI6_9BASI|nr:hypothetical protein BDZ90DRAFT_234252 [Jaminaea rosea]PWN25436.1 hypothetical protein BDZ90DRAFT_234252 [Jaminaea rosea]